VPPGAREEIGVILVLGGGLAGLSTAYHLAQLLPSEPRLVLEREAECGGLARSLSGGGFTFDLTGHYLHLRDPAIAAWVDELLGPELASVERDARIQVHGVRVPYPLQAHLHGLPVDLVARCVVDFCEASRAAPPDDPLLPFDEWARRSFGSALAELFMIPYTRKLFRAEPSELTSEWTSWSVPRPDLHQVVAGALGAANRGMGYNASFLYPRSGGIARLGRALAERVGGDLRCEASVESVDPLRREVTLQGREVLPWRRLVSTIPLPVLLRSLVLADGDGSPRRLADDLRWTSVIDLQLGIGRAGVGDGAHWIYFPEPELPFYRVGFPSNVCAALAPAGCSALSVELSHPAGTPPPALPELLPVVRNALVAAGVLRDSDEVVFARVALIDPAYVVFDARRTPAVRDALSRLLAAGIRSIGRFGGWTYSYMERALLDGKETASALAAEAASAHSR
jgi:protoporphyrinogen oxidase